MTAAEPGARRSGPASNAAWFMAADLVGKGAGFVLVVVVARGLGTRQYGYFAFALAFVPLFLQLARWGLDTATVRQLADDPERLSPVVVNAGVLRVVLAAVASLAAVAVAVLMVDGGTARTAVAVLGGALFVDELTTYLTVVFQAFERMRLTAVVLIVNRVTSTLLAVAVVGAGGGLVAVCATYGLGSLVALAAAAVLFARGFGPLDRHDLRSGALRSLLREGAPYGIASSLNMAVFRVDTLLLQAILGAVSVGMYGVAYRFFEPLLFVTWSVASAVFPRLVKERDRPAEGRTFELALAAVLVFYLPIAVGAPFAAEWAVRGAFSDRYLPAASAATWLLAATAFYAVAHLTRIACIARDQRSRLVWVAGAALVGNVAANLVVIPSHGVTGAAAVTFGTEVLEAAALLGLYLRSGGRVHIGGPVLTPILASGGMAAALAVSGARDGTAVIGGLVTYPVLLLVVGRVLLDRDALADLRRLRPSEQGTDDPAVEHEQAETRGQGCGSASLSSVMGTADFLRSLGVPELPARTSPFDPGYDPATVASHLAQSASLMSVLKLSMACWLVAGEGAIRSKLAAAQAHGVRTTTGGGPFEVAVAQGRLDLYLDLCAELGFDRIECGAGFTDLAVDASDVVGQARARDLEVQFELGHKHGGPFDVTTVATLVDEGRRWLDAGAVQLVIEARENAQGVGLFDRAGEFDAEAAERFVNAFGFATIVFEAPTKSSQFAFLDHFGPEVSLSNVRLEELLRVEIYRRGLHSDAFLNPRLRPPMPEG